MAHAQLSRQCGFTLIEFLVAIVIIMVGMLGLLQAVNVAISSNRQNQMRNEAGLVLDQWLSNELSKGFGRISSSYSGFESRPVLNGFVNFSVTRTVTVSTSQNSKEVNFLVTWPYRGTRYSYKGGGVSSNNAAAQ